MQYPGLQVYVLGRTENAGYVSFRNDTSIVSGIANIFPVFFILIALLVCITTMTRMVAEERTQIGTLKALGVRGIAVKYLLYAGSATAIGWGVGFFAGTFFLPKVFWYAYHSLYSFAPIRFVFSLPLALLTGLASLLGILAAAFFCCHGTLTEVPARLLRPKGLKSGRRILLEHIAPLWRRFSFLTKVMLRNLFRYKQRFVMMLCGIACCAALVVAAFGVRDSMLGIAAWHYDTVQTYGVSASFDSAEKDAVTAFAQTASGVLGYTTCLEERVELHREGQTLSSVYLFAFADTADAEGYFSFHQGDRQLPFPGQGEALLSTQAAEKLGVREGDSLTVWDSANKEMTVTVCGIYDNYIEHYLIVGAQTYADAYGAYAQNTLLLRTEGDTQPIAEALTALSAVRSVTQLPVIRGRVDSALFCLNYVIWLVVAFSFALAFIVIFNLTNINLAERSRDVATVEVLGFTPRETQRYVLHENILLSFFAAILGMPLGTLLHRAVMQMIVIDSVCFGRSIRWQSYLLGFVCTLCFAFLVNLFMRRQIRKIKMAESLKAVE